MSASTAPIVAWIGCYTDQAGDHGLVSLTGTPSALARTGTATLTSPSWLTPLDPQTGTWLAVSETEDSALSVVDFRGPGAVVTSSVPTGGVHACHASANPSGEWICVAHYTSGSVALLAAPETAGLRPPVDLVTFTGSSGAVPDRQEAPHPHQIVWLDDSTLLVPDLGADLIRVLGVEASSGAGARLVEASPIELPPGTGPRHLVLRTPAGTAAGRDETWDLAVVGELSGEVLSYQHRDGQWTLVHQVASSKHPGAQPSGFRSFPAGDVVAVANRGVNTISTLTWAPSGMLALVDEFDCSGEHPRDLVINEGSVWVALQHSDAVAVFEPDTTGWALSGRVGIDAPACIAIVAVSPEA